MKRLGLLVALAAGMFLTQACVPLRSLQPALSDAEAVRVTILHVNDVHGALEPQTVKGQSIGGYARLATLVEEERASSKAARVFLIHAGDEFSRGDDLTRTTLGAANIAIMNHLKFDAWLPGNGDHYDGAAVLLARVREAKFPVLSANVNVVATGEAVGKPYIIEQAGPVRIAFLGLCLVKPDGACADEFVADYPFTVAEKWVPELRKQADAVVVVSHLGALRDVELAELVPGIDLIVGAHTHTEMPEGVRVKVADEGSVLVVQTGQKLKYLGKVGLVFGRSDGRWRLASSSATLIPIDAKVKMDPGVTALIAKWAAENPTPAKPETPKPVPVLVQ